MGFSLNCSFLLLTSLDGDTTLVVCGMCLGRDFCHLVCSISEFISVLTLKSSCLPGLQNSTCNIFEAYMGPTLFQTYCQYVLVFRERPQAGSSLVSWVQQ